MNQIFVVKVFEDGEMSYNPERKTWIPYFDDELHPCFKAMDHVSCFLSLERFSMEIVNKVSNGIFLLFTFLLMLFQNGQNFFPLLFVCLLMPEEKLDLTLKKEREIGKIDPYTFASAETSFSTDTI